MSRHTVDRLESRLGLVKALVKALGSNKLWLAKVATPTPCLGLIPAKSRLLVVADPSLRLALVDTPVASARTRQSKLK